MFQVFTIIPFQVKIKIIRDYFENRFIINSRFFFRRSFSTIMKSKNNLEK